MSHGSGPKEKRIEITPLLLVVLLTFENIYKANTKKKESRRCLKSIELEEEDITRERERERKRK